MTSTKKKQSEATRFKKGKSGNPSGRPKGAKDGIEANLRRILEKAPPKAVWEKLKKLGIKDARGSNAKAIAETLVLMAIRGDIQAMKLVKEYEIGTKITAHVTNGISDELAEFLLEDFLGVKK